jgi:hypothetical protein
MRFEVLKKKLESTIYLQSQKRNDYNCPTIQNECIQGYQDRYKNTISKEKDLCDDMKKTVKSGEVGMKLKQKIH